MDFLFSSGLTRNCFILFIATSVAAVASAITHTQTSTFCMILFEMFLVLSGLSFLRILNHVASRFPSWLRSGIHWVHAIAFELLAIVFIFPCLQLFRSHKNYEKMGGKPVLLVHGYRKNGSVWFFLKNYLLNNGVGPIYLISLGNSKASIHEHVEKVKQKCEEIKIQTGCSELTLIGHSMGGLVCVLSAIGLDYVTDVITIVSPLKGTKIAKIGLGLSAREMEVGSSLTTQLQKKIVDEQTIRFFHIGTQTDHIVIPNRSAFLGIHPDREFLFKDIGHASMLLSSRVAQLLLHLYRYPVNHTARD